MLRTRLVSAAILVPIAAVCIYLGDWAFFALVTVWLSIATVEWRRLHHRRWMRPVAAWGLAMVWLHTLDAQMAAWSLLPAGITLVTLASLAWHTLRQREEPIASWSLMIAGGFYLGQCGTAMIQLRRLSPDGRWWALTVLSATALADAGAYLIGRRIGRHALAPHISPGKTWEGYGAGIITGSVSSGLLAWLWSVATDATTLTLWRGLLIGILVTTIAPLGDLAISAMKRSAGAKDSGRIMPGHGGALDRADSMLWAAVVGYYAVQALVALGSSAQ